MFAGRVLGLAPQREFLHDRTDRLLSWVREDRGDAAADSLFDLYGYPRTFGVLVEISSSVSWWPHPSQMAEVYPYGLNGDCSPAARDSAELAEAYPVGTEVLVRGRQTLFMPPLRADERFSLPARVEVWFPANDFFRHQPEGYDPTGTTLFDYSRLLTGDRSVYGAVGRADAEYELWKDLGRLRMSVGRNESASEAVSHLRRLASYPWFIGCTECYGRLVFNHIDNARAASDLLGHLAAVQESNPAIAERFKTYGSR